MRRAACRALFVLLHTSLFFFFCDTSRDVPLIGDFSLGRTKDPRFMGTWIDTGYAATAAPGDFYSGVLYSQLGFYSEQRSTYTNGGIAPQQVYQYTVVVNGDWYCQGDTLYTKSVRYSVERPLSGGSASASAPSLDPMQSAQRYQFRGNDTLAFYTGSYTTGIQDTTWEFSIFIRTTQ
jgi:hypothetical protein